MKDAAPPKRELFDVDIEASLIGSLLKDNRRIDLAASEIEPHHLYDGLHQRIFEMVVALYSEGEVTPLILHSVMRTDAGLIEMQGIAYLRDMMLAAPAMPVIKEYCRLLKELAVRRDLVRIGGELMVAAEDMPAEVASRHIADGATEALLQVGRVTAKAVISVYDIARETVKELEEIARGNDVPRVKIGLHSVDDEFGGLRGGNFIVLTGKSGMGKSAVAGCISRNTAQAGIPTLVFSKEMTRKEWVDRMVCDEDFDTAERPMWYSRVNKGRLNDSEFERYLVAAQRLDGIPLDIRDEDDLNIMQISAIARAFKAKHGGKLGLVIVDYLQIVEPLDYRENRERQVAQIARGLKSLAKRLNWPVIALSQMNENDAQRAKEEKRPQLSDLRESKVIGQEADVVLAPHRPAYFVENKKPDCGPGDPAWIAWHGELTNIAHRFDLLCLKNRHGRRLDFELWCEIGSSAIRDEAPRRVQSQADQDAANLLTGVR